MYVCDTCGAALIGPVCDVPAGRQVRVTELGSERYLE